MARTNLHRLAHLEYVGTSIELTIEMAEASGGRTHRRQETCAQERSPVVILEFAGKRPILASRMSIRGPLQLKSNAKGKEI